MTTELAPAPASTDVVLRLHDVHTYYGAIHALRGLNVEVHRGEIVTLIGANGAGKTTTLRTISGLLHARTGTVELEGKDITKVLAHELVTRGIGHAPEGRRIFSRLTVYENLLMGGFTRSKAENEEQVAHVYELFPRLKERHEQKGGTLSGGEQQMLAIGRALMTCITWATMSGASPIDGSSSISIFGPAMSARPIASICCSPPDRVPPCWARRSARSGSSSKTSSTRLATRPRSFTR